MKIVLHILNTKTYSGAENVAITIIKELEKDKRYKAYYVSPRGDIERKLIAEGIKYIPVDKLCTKELKRVVKEYKPDVIHAHDFRASIFSSIAVQGDTKIISHIHCNPSWIKKVNFYSILYAICSIRYKKILTVSKAILDEYVFGGAIAHKSQVIGNIIDIEEIKIKSQEQYGIPNFYDICFCGRLSKEKDPIRFIRIICEIKKQIPNIIAVIIGDGELMEQCLELIKKEELDKNIKMMGFLDNPFCIMKNCKLLCMTSKWEGYGLVAAESLALGKPVIATNVGGIPSIVDESCGKTCNNDESMIDEITRLLMDNNYYKFKSTNAKNKINKINNRAEYMQRLKDIYEKK